jgi:hypothetical protein
MLQLHGQLYVYVNSHSIGKIEYIKSHDHWVTKFTDSVAPLDGRHETPIAAVQELLQAYRQRRWNEIGELERKITEAEQQIAETERIITQLEETSGGLLGCVELNSN